VQLGGLSIVTTVENEADIEVFGKATGIMQYEGYVNVDPGGTTGSTVHGEAPSTLIVCPVALVARAEARNNTNS
jgi:hypothetical protein